MLCRMPSLFFTSTVLPPEDEHVRVELARLLVETGALRGHSSFFPLVALTVTTTLRCRRLPDEEGRG